MAKKKEVKKSHDIGGQLKNIKVLYNTKRLKESIAYMYMLYTQICAMKWNEKRQPSQSIRDYAMIMVKKFGQNPANVYPFIQQVESIIYGGRQPSQDVMNQTIVLFGNVFQELTGKPLPQLI